MVDPLIKSAFPEKSDELLANLVAAYPHQALYPLVLGGHIDRAMALAGKLELIEELIELRRQAYEQEIDDEDSSAD